MLYPAIWDIEKVTGIAFLIGIEEGKGRSYDSRGDGSYPYHSNDGGFAIAGGVQLSTASAR
jgi:hypothetical protein